LAVTLKHIANQEQRHRTYSFAHGNQYSVGEPVLGSFAGLWDRAIA